MRADIELDVDRQTVQAGDEVHGRLIVRGVTHCKSLTVSLQGEEVLGAGSLVRSLVFPFLEEVQQFEPPTDPDERQMAFSFRIPEAAPPSYSSQDVRCQYYLKARLHLGGGLSLGRLAGDTIKRLHLTVLPPPPGPPQEGQRELTLEEGGVRLVATLDRTHLPVGQTLTGCLELHRDTEETELPSRLTFRLAAIEESLDPGYNHRQVLWVQSRDVEPEPEMDFPLEGNFQFPIPQDAPFSGDWNSFRIHYGFRVGMSLLGGKQVRESLPIGVSREYVPEEA